MSHPAETAPAILMEGVNKYYGAFQALKGIDFRVANGERIVLCGPSGSGKSTLVRCINRLETVQSGRIVVDGIDLAGSRKNVDAVRRDVGMVFQQFNLFPHMTVLENCMLAPLKVRGTSRDEARATAMRLLVRVQIEAQANSNGWRSPGRCACRRASCCSTSRPPHSIRRWSRRCSTPWSGSRPIP